MLRGRTIAAVAGALALLGATGGQARAQAVNDPTGAVRDGIGYLGVPGTTLRLRISRDLLANDIGRNIRFLRASLTAGRGDNPGSDGIRSIRRSGNLLLIRLRNGFNGTASFRYEITFRNARGRTIRDSANVFVVADEASPS